MSQVEQLQAMNATHVTHSIRCWAAQHLQTLALIVGYCQWHSANRAQHREETRVLQQKPQALGHA
jgi:hypothetical protein